MASIPQEQYVEIQYAGQEIDPLAAKLSVLERRFDAHIGKGGNVHASATQQEAGFISAEDKTKLDGVENGSTQNSTDAFLLNRGNHTGEQPIESVTGLRQQLDDALAGGSNYRGLFPSLAALDEAIPVAVAGNYADVDEGEGIDAIRYIWDDSDQSWVSGGAGEPLTAPQVKALYEANPNTNALTNLRAESIDDLSGQNPQLTYSAGVTLERATQTFVRGNIQYRIKDPSDLPYTITGDWDMESEYFVSMGDGGLRQDLAAEGGAGMVGYTEGAEYPAGSIGYVLAGMANTGDFVYPRQFGAQPETDATEALQQALLDPRPVMIIDEPYFHNPENPLIVPSGKTIWFVGAGRTTAIPCDSGSHRAFDVTMREDVTFINPQVYGERAGHIGTTGESGFGIYILSSKDVRVFGGKMKDWWGDGIYIGAFNTSTHYNCERILIDNVECDNNRRQGMSITAAIDVTVRGGKFNNTNGTAPESGIDIEPNAGFLCQDIKLLSVETKGNAGSGIMSVNVAGGGDAEACKGIYIENPISKDNGFHGIRLIKSLDTTVFGGTSSGNGGSGVDLSSGCNDAKIKGITSKGNGTYGIGALSAAGDNITIEDNKVYDNAGHGIDVDASSPNANVVNNDCRRNGLSGIRTQGTNATVKLNRTVNNVLVNTAAKNLEVTGAGSTTAGNFVRASGSGALTGVAISGSSQTVMGNDFRGAGVTTDLSNTATGSVVRDNFPKVASSTTAGRPALYLQPGDSLFDITLGKPIWWNGTVWKDSSGTTV